MSRQTALSPTFQFFTLTAVRHNDWLSNLSCVTPALEWGSSEFSECHRKYHRRGHAACYAGFTEKTFNYSVPVC